MIEIVMPLMIVDHLFELDSLGLDYILLEEDYLGICNYEKEADLLMSFKTGRAHITDKQLILVLEIGTTLTSKTIRFRSEREVEAKAKLKEIDTILGV